MKKIISLALLFAVLLSVISSKSMTKSFQIQGFCDDIVTVVMEAIPSQTQNYRIGMPFNIEDIQVQNDQKDGRKIGEWSVGANAPFILEFQPEPLKHVDGTSKDLPYVLAYSYTLAGTGHSNKDNSFKINTALHQVEFENNGGDWAYDAGLDRYSVNIFGDSSIDTGAYAGILRGNIYFKFPSTITRDALADNTAYPPGEYSAQVKVWIKGVD